MTFLTRFKFNQFAKAGRTSPSSAIVSALILSLGVAGSLLTGLNAQAQAFPNKPIRLVCPFPPGGAVDIASRAIAQELSKNLGQPVTVDNKPGAGGNIGGAEVARANPDGYTIFMTTSGIQAINPALYAKMPFDPNKDLIPVTALVSLNNVLVLHPSVKANSVAEVIALAKSQPGAINYASSAKAAQEVASLAQAMGAQTMLLPCDVSDEVAVRAMLAQVEAQFGHLDALVNNAGTTAKWKVKDLESLDLAEWDRTFAVNVRGLFQVTRAAVPLLKKGHNPSIVNTASIVGLRPGPQPLPYAASKAAVVNMTKTLAWNLGPEIRVNAVAPGWMEGDWMERMLGDKYDDLMGKRAKLTPLKRCVTADDVAETMMSLIQGNRFVTGEIIVIDGGFTSST